MIDALATLNFIWQFLKPAGADALKDRLKPKSSAESAVRKLVAVYRRLEEISNAVDDFIDIYEHFVKQHEQYEQDKPDMEGFLVLCNQRVSIEDKVEAIVNSLIRLTDSLDAVDPQLGIHKPELVSLLENFGITEAMTADYVHQEVLPRLSLDLEREVLVQANQNRELLAKAIIELRSFIANEFSFKEMF